MGASSSIDNISLPRHIHMSYPNTKNKRFIHDKLKEELEEYSLMVSKTDYTDFNLNVSNINKCEFVIICLLENSISDPNQIKELSLAEIKTKNINEALMTKLVMQAKGNLDKAEAEYIRVRKIEITEEIKKQNQKE